MGVPGLTVLRIEEQRILLVTFPWPSEVTFVSQDKFFVVFSFNISFLWWFFQVHLLNLMKFQTLCNISMSLCACLNYLLGLGNTPLGERHMSWHDWACYNRQLCELLTDSLALTYIPYLYIVAFLCIMCLMYDVMWVKEFHYRQIIMAKIYFMVKGCTTFCERATTKNV